MPYEQALPTTLHARQKCPIVNEKRYFYRISIERIGLKRGRISDGEVFKKRFKKRKQRPCPVSVESTLGGGEQFTQTTEH